MLKLMKKLAIVCLVVAAAATSVNAAKTWNDTPPDAVRPDRSADSVAPQVRREMQAKNPDLRSKPAPFLRLPIPEPLELPRMLGLREFPADNDAPVTATGIQPRPVLQLNAK